MKTIYYTAASLDGRLTDGDGSLGWLQNREFHSDGPMSLEYFKEHVGAAAMGASTWQWLLEDGDPLAWTGDIPLWVFTHREYDARPGVTFTSSPVAEVHEAMVEAAGGPDAYGTVWLIGGGDLAGQFADARLLDEIWVQYAPVTLGSGAALMNTGVDLRLEEVARNGEFVCARYLVVPPGGFGE